MSSHMTAPGMGRSQEIASMFMPMSMTSGAAEQHLHAVFLALMPRIERHARIVFRNINCPDRKADRIADCLALAWKWYVRLNEREIDVRRFPMAFIALVAKAVKSGRRVTGQLKAKDVMSELAQQRHNFLVGSLPSCTAASRDRLYSRINGQRQQDEYEERLVDNTMTPPDEQATFRLDFKAWLKTLTPRERRIIKAMSRNERTRDLSRQFELSEGRISQMRRQFLNGWKCFVGDEPVYCRGPLRRSKKRARAVLS